MRFLLLALLVCPMAFAQQGQGESAFVYPQETVGELAGVTPVPEPLPARWNNLIAGYKLDEESGNPRLDVLGVHTMSETGGAVGHETGIIGNGAGGDTEINYLETPTASPFAAWTGGGVRTVLLWFKRVPLSGGTSYGVGNSHFTDRDPGTWNFSNGSPNTFFFAYVDALGVLQSSSGRGFSTDTWDMYVGWFDQDMGQIWLEKNNDEVIFPQTITNPLTSNTVTDPLFIRFARVSGDMAIDEVYIFSDVKDAAWRTDMYNGGVARTYPE